MERGRINASSVHWIPLEDYTIIDKGIRDGRDYHTLAWDRREVDLDDLGAPVDHVVVSETVDTFQLFEKFNELLNHQQMIFFSSF